MLTTQECTICQRNCNPTGHKFPALEAPPSKENTRLPRTPVTSPPPPTEGGGDSALSPTSRLVLNDASLDMDLGVRDNPMLFDGQSLSNQGVDELSLADNVRRNVRIAILGHFSDSLSRTLQMMAKKFRLLLTNSNVWTTNNVRRSWRQRKIGRKSLLRLKS